MLYFARWKILLVLGIVLGGLLYAMPNVFPAGTFDRLPEWGPKHQVNLGLDLQGGAHLLYEMDERELIDDWLSSIRGEVRDTLRRQRIGYTNLRQSVPNRSVTVEIRDPAQMDRAYTALRNVAQPISDAVWGGVSGYTLDVERRGNNEVLLTLTEAGITQRINSGIEASIETVRRRIDQFGTTEPSIQRQGRARVLVQVPGIQDVERLKALVGETGKLEFKLVDQNANASEIAQTKRPPPGSELLFSEEEPVQPYVVEAIAMVGGENLVDAQPGFDSRTSEPIVTFRFDATGAKRFARVTQENVGRPFAIVLDNKVISAPVIREPILGGSGQISGRFTVQEANDLSILLRSGALPAKLTPIEERTVGASLGADSIEAGKRAAGIGLIAVALFMIAAYGLFGVFAVFALAVNMALIFAALSLIGATLTLPGIAGIILVIGMAVDANVLIFERIREEIRSGKSPMAAIDSGYSRAMGTIIDSNMTTLISTLVLFWLGSGPIRGFAITLCIGIVTSFFTAVTFNRLVVTTWLRWTRPALIPI
jgi:preprotein translocase subunit SecD